MRPRRLTELQRLVVIEAYVNRDASCRELAAVYGMHNVAMYRTYLRGYTRAKSAGLDNDLAITLRKRGVHIAKIARECEVSKATVERLLTKVGLVKPRK